MARILEFKIKNFKGIEEVGIRLDGKSDCPVTTLIGLNESGKTTILEALSHFTSGDRSVSALFDGTHPKSSGVGLIPVHKKAAFTSSVQIAANIELNDADISAISNLAEKFKLQVDVKALSASFAITKQIDFEDSILKEATNYYGFSLLTRTKKKNTTTSFKEYIRPTDPNAPDLWLETANHILSQLPQISYFPTFLVDMPRRIYLEEHEGEKPVNRYYRLVFQDILDSLNEDLRLERHVSKRIKDYQKSQNSVNWFSMFLGSPSKAPIDSVFQKISNAVTREVLGSWQKVFQRAISAKSIFVEWNIDTEKGNLPYASFQVSDGESRYAISERSLGFRWFFSFLLFTAFKHAKTRSTIFVFDEPAANLHAKAQAELLTSFSRIASDGNRVIYSTHSHHMINPQWLSGAYIIENTALDYETSDSFGLTTKPTNIIATTYREFLNKFPSRSSYFQPVIEKLEYVSPEIIGNPPFVVVEGISDYHALKLAMRESKGSPAFQPVPGVGSGASGPLLSQMMGRGEKFVVLLDDDKAGRREAERYRSEWFLGDEDAFTLAAVDPEFSGKRLEELLDEETISSVKATFGLTSEPSKKQIGLFLAEAFAANVSAKGVLGAQTLARLKKVLAHLEAHFSGASKQKAKAKPPVAKAKVQT